MDGVQIVFQTVQDCAKGGAHVGIKPIRLPHVNLDIVKETVRGLGMKTCENHESMAIVVDRGQGDFHADIRAVATARCAHPRSRR